MYLVQDEQNGEEYALKRLLMGDSSDVANCKREIKTMQQLKNHKNIVQLVDYTLFTNQKGEQEANLLLELCSRNFFFYPVTFVLV